MHALRQFLHAHRRSAALFCALALALRLLIPGGFMVSAGEHGIAITLCPGTTPTAAMAMAGGGHHAETGHAGDQAPAEHGGGEVPCAFAGLSAPVLGGADAVLMIVALAFTALLLLFAAPRRPVPVHARLRPPLRGPPLPR